MVSKQGSGNNNLKDVIVKLNLHMAIAKEVLNASELNKLNSRAWRYRARILEC